MLKEDLSFEGFKSQIFREKEISRKSTTNYEEVRNLQKEMSTFKKLKSVLKLSKL